MTRQLRTLMLLGVMAGVAAGQTKPAPAKAAPAVKAVAAKASPRTTAPKPLGRSGGKRDPFISPVRLQDEQRRSNPACTTGPRCLDLQQVVLKGTVKTVSGMIAMVETATKKQYNLREKDTVQNGFVLRITMDSIVFRETATDPFGRTNTREVVKRVTVPVV